MIYNPAIGTFITPPAGSGLYVGASVGKVKVEEVIKPLLPFLRRDIGGSVINYLHSEITHRSTPAPQASCKRIVSCTSRCRMAIRVFIRPTHDNNYPQVITVKKNRLPMCGAGKGNK